MFRIILLSLVISGNTTCPPSSNSVGTANISAKSYQIGPTYYDGKMLSLRGIAEPEQADGNHVDSDTQKQWPKVSPVDKRRAGDLIPTDPSPLLEGRLHCGKEGAVLLANRWSSLHPEQDYYSSSYSGRSAPGPVHGGDPHGGDLHDEVHDAGLPANQANRDYYPDNSDPYGGTVPR